MGEKSIKYKINWETVSNIVDFDVEYNEEDDILYMQSRKQLPAVSVDCDGEFWCRINPETGEILGIEIEDFQRVYLRNHPELLKEMTADVRPIAKSIQVASCPA